MALTKLKEFMGWTISVAEDGTFIGERTNKGYYSRSRADTLKRKNLRDLEREIASRASGHIEVMNFKRPWKRTDGDTSTYNDYIPSGQTALRRVVIVQAADGGKLRDENGYLHTMGTVALYDEAIIAKVLDFKARLEAAQQVIFKEYYEWAMRVPITFLSEKDIQAMLVAQREEAEAAGTEAE